jgi:hypothetical protein
MAFLQNPAIAGGPGQFGAIQASAPSFGLEVRPINVRDAGETERAITAFARSGNGGLIVAGGAPTALQRDVVIKLAARHRPADLPVQAPTKYELVINRTASSEIMLRSQYVIPR